MVYIKTIEITGILGEKNIKCYFFNNIAKHKGNTAEDIAVREATLVSAYNPDYSRNSAVLTSNDNRVTVEVEDWYDSAK